MRLVLDASALVGDLLRVSGRVRLADDRLELFLAQHTADEVAYELPRRIAAFAARHGLDETLTGRLVSDCRAAIDANVEIVPEVAYAPLEDEARWRSARDPDDWAVVAAALAVGGGIWTNDNDFLGTGVATWTTDTITAWLAQSRR
jgi:predicted nucleic acid-binding protein